MRNATLATQPDRWRSTRFVARVSDVDERTVQRWCRARRVRARRLPGIVGRWRVLTDAAGYAVPAGKAWVAR